MTVAEFIEKLKALPQDAEVVVADQNDDDFFDREVRAEEVTAYRYPYSDSRLLRDRWKPEDPAIRVVLVY